MNSKHKVALPRNQRQDPKEPSSLTSGVLWPFPKQLLRPHDAPPLSSSHTPTFADMTTELGEARW